MKLELYLSHLLYRYPCVIVPGFGAFLTEYQPARLAEAANTLYPPKKTISFNSYLISNDGLLTNHIAHLEKNSYEATLSAVEGQVTQWKKTLEDYGKISLKNIGEIILNAEGKYVFIAYDTINYLMDSFGLSAFNFPAIKREVEIDIFQIPVTDAIHVEGIPIIPIDTKRNKRRIFMKYAAIVTLTLGVSGVLATKWYEDSINKKTVLVEKAVELKVQQKIQEATFFISNPIPSVTLSIQDESDKPYQIVAGVFRLEENASRNCADLIRKGFKAERISPNRHGLFPVIYGKYSNSSEAEAALNNIRATENSDAWILIDEKK